MKKQMTKAQIKAYLAKKELEANLGKYQKYLIQLVGALGANIDELEAVNNVMPQIATNGLVKEVNNFLNSINFHRLDIPKDKRTNETDEQWTEKIEDWNRRNEEHKDEINDQYVKSVKLYTDFQEETFIIE
jgi:poly-beta-hydroxyalkanoate depolymerase